MKPLNNNILLITACIFIASCKAKIDSPVPSKGEADFSRYVALGSSFTSGYTDEALYLEGQQNSFPSMLAQVFGEAGGGIFKQPLVNEGVGIGIYGNAKLTLTNGTHCGTAGYITPFAALTGDHSIWTSSVSSGGPFNNLGVPGTRCYNFNDQYFGDPQLGNPFYSRFAKIPGTSTLLSEAVEIAPTFFTLLIGMEDIFSFAIKGGDNNPGDTITSVAYFNSNVDVIINTLVSAGAKGAVANIPDITDFPFFSRIPYNGLVLTAAEAQNLNAIFNSIDPGIIYHEGNNPYLVTDAARPSGLRQLQVGELVLMSIPVDSICKGYGSFKVQAMQAWAFDDKYVLDLAELSLIHSRIFGFNDKLAIASQENNLAYINLYDFFRKLTAGIIFNGVTFSSKFITGKAISLNGLHPTPQGYALIANEFIKAINSKYGATLHEVDPNSYPGIHLP